MSKENKKIQGMIIRLRPGETFEMKDGTLVANPTDKRIVVVINTEKTNFNKEVCNETNKSEK